ncbi:uncharacterized protein BX664DRAFT_255451, partial [Halteromyces radiatus]|uniref:uncharacterized protein n=1 Tax=Halteromyces radiatus TaxID=101107 RepID=UPI00221EE6B3
IRVLGVPSLGAKSRVETQIKLCIQLLSPTGTKVLNWSYLRLPECMLARSKLRKTQQQKLLDGSVATMVSDESKVLNLEAKVICSTNTSKAVRMCPGCVRRERKRAERTKDGKPRYETDIISDSNELDPQRRAEDIMERDRNRILLFNCSPMVNFSSGDAILPTRITCYCRHHNEKVGFRIQFVMRNDQGSIIAKGCSPPIMITDDHKSSKQRNNTPSRRGSLSDNNNNNNNNSNIVATPLHLNPSASFVIPSSTSNDMPLWRSDYTPQLERLVPSQGPTYGGVEVTVLGSGFYRGLTCLFGEHAASTVYWNPNTLVCVLPPAATPGPVVVSFKEHPIVLEGQDVALFTYYDASDQALLELALQVVGLKMTGKLHDAKHIAMLIVRGDQQRSQSQSQSQQQNIESMEQPIDGNDDDSQSTFTDTSDAHDMMHTNPNGHTMLHLAVLLRYGALTRLLLDKIDRRLIDQADRNGCTALHFACLQNNTPMVQLLLEAGAQPTETCSIGSTLELTTDNTIKSMLLESPSLSSKSIESSPSSSSTTSTSLSTPRRLSFKSHVRRFYFLKQQRGDNTTDNTNQSIDTLDDNGLGFVQYKSDRRLYLFWLPLLIGKKKKKKGNNFILTMTFLLLLLF